MQVQPGQNKASLVDVIDRILDKGLVINADVQVALCGIELLGIRIRAVLASFETAARYGLEFPFGSQLPDKVVAEAAAGRESCPGCFKRSPVTELLDRGCPWCGWQSARALRLVQASGGQAVAAGLPGVPGAVCMEGCV